MQVKDGYSGRLDHANLRGERRSIAVVANRRTNGVQGCGSIMIKDIVANLSVGISRDVATEFGVSAAATLDSLRRPRWPCSMTPRGAPANTIWGIFAASNSANSPMRSVSAHTHRNRGGSVELGRPDGDQDGAAVNPRQLRT